MALFGSRLDTVFHVGDLTKNRRPNNVTSLEGGELSVSLHPDAWRAIAKLSGPTWRLHKANANFLHVYPGTRHGARAAREWLQWSVDHEYLKPRRWFRVEWHDEEDDDQRYVDFELLKEAQAEVEEEAVDGQPRTLREVDHYAFDKRGVAYWRKAFGKKGRLPDEIAPDFAPIFFGRAHGYDGVWWHERFDPAALSAPRGCIFQARLPEWTRTKLV